jgi:hypothetical protein
MPDRSRKSSAWRRSGSSSPESDAAAVAAPRRRFRKVRYRRHPGILGALRSIGGFVWINPAIWQATHAGAGFLGLLLPVGCSRTGIRRSHRFRSATQVNDVWKSGIELRGSRDFLSADSQITAGVNAWRHTGTFWSP